MAVRKSLRRAMDLHFQVVILNVSEFEHTVGKTLLGLVVPLIEPGCDVGNLVQETHATKIVGIAE